MSDKSCRSITTLSENERVNRERWDTKIIEKRLGMGNETHSENKKFLHPWF